MTEDHVDGTGAEPWEVRRLVLKIGSSVVTLPAYHDGVSSLQIDRNTIYRLAHELAAVNARGIEVVVVSSGAVALGVEELDLAARPGRLADIQAVAAVGQGLLMHLWREAFARHRLKVGQVLLTHADLADRTRFLNVRGTVDSLLAHSVVPIVNENDTVATEEITVGDNDHLAVQVAKLCGGDLLILLSTVDGLLDAEDAVVAKVALQDDPTALVSETSSPTGRGGMASKLAAASAAAHGGVGVVIANGKRPGLLARILAGESVGTRFEHEAKGLPSRKHWIAYTLRPTGLIRLDEGATRAVRAGGASVLPVGVTAAEGDFKEGDAVRILDPDGGEIARGLVRQDAASLRERMGRKGPIAVHRDDLVRRFWAQTAEDAP